MKYAEYTEVSSEKSRIEIERILAKYGAEQFMYRWKEKDAIIGFRMNDRYIRFILPLPDKNSSNFKETPTGRRRKNPDAALAAWEQATRQRWRALALTIKAKLEAVECEITEFESEFLAHIVMPDGKTVSEHIIPKIGEAYRLGKLPPLLPGV